MLINIQSGRNGSTCRVIYVAVLHLNTHIKDCGSPYVACIKMFNVNFRYLQHCFADVELLSLKSFEIYVPVDSQDKAPVAKSEIPAWIASNSHMVVYINLYI